MKKILKYVLILAAISVTTVASSSCLRQNMIMYEDGEFDGADFTDEDLMLNAEIEMDDLYRD